MKKVYSVKFSALFLQEGTALVKGESEDEAAQYLLNNMKESEEVVNPAILDVKYIGEEYQFVGFDNLEDDSSFDGELN